MRQIILGVSLSAVFALVGCAEVQRPALAVGQTTTTGATLCGPGLVAAPDDSCVPAQNATDLELDIP